MSSDQEVPSTPDPHWAFRREFASSLHANPTAALNRYCSLYANRHSTLNGEADFWLMTETFKLELTYRSWRSLSDSELQSQLRVTNTKSMHRLAPEPDSCAEVITDISAELWDAIIETQLPLFWLDVLIREGDFRSPVCTPESPHSLGACDVN